MTTRNTTPDTLTFGIEIETKRLTNLQAAQAVAAVIGGTVREMLINGRRDYYQSWLVVLPDGREWRCMSDASLTGVASEVVSPIMKGRDDVAMVQQVVRGLRRAGAKVDAECGIHVHVGAQGMDARVLGNLTALVYSCESLIKGAVGTLPARARWCRDLNENTVKGVKKAKTLDDAGAAWYGSASARDAGRREHYNSTRYSGLNLHNVWFRGTVEFRYFNATLHAGRVRSYIELCLGLAAYAHNARSIPARKRATSYDDQKWTMYRLLYHRLGLTGAYYKNVRDHLTANLPGSLRGGSRTSDRLGGTARPVELDAAA